MAEYNMQELNLPGEDGKRILYPRMKLYGQVNLDGGPAVRMYAVNRGT